MPASRPRTLALFWHVHQPFFVPDAEVAEQVAESYEPLLALHERLELPFSLNVSGGLLLRLSELAPAFVERLAAAIENGLVEIVASGAYHPLLPLLPPARAQAQIELDLEAKQEILGVDPKGFWPADLGWTHWLVPILARAGLEWTVVDGAARTLASALPSWEPEERLGQTVLTPKLRPLVFAGELGKLAALRLGEAHITAVARHPGLCWRLVDNDHGVLYDPSTLPAFLEELDAHFASGASLLVIGDDGERVNGRTLVAYEGLLRALAEHVDTLSLGSNAVAASAMTAETSYFPTSTFLVDLDAWLDSADDRACLALLADVQRELANAESFARLSQNQALLSTVLEISRELLPAEDSGFYFWKFLRRTREPFIEKLMALGARLRALGR